MIVVEIAMVVGALAVSAVLGAPLIGAALRRLEPGEAVPGVLRGGMWIGVLERLAVTGAVIAEVPEAVAVVIAIKGLGRYPELRESETGKRGLAGERFIIGTLASYLWAAVAGVGARALLDTLA